MIMHETECNLFNTPARIGLLEIKAGILQFPKCNVLYCAIAGLLFTWITPLMQQGYKKPIVEADIWKLDSWDQTEELYKKYI